MKVLIQRFWREPVVALAVAAVILEVAAVGPFGLPSGAVAVIAALQAALTRRLVSPAPRKR